MPGPDLDLNVAQPNNSGLFGGNPLGAMSQIMQMRMLQTQTSMMQQKFAGTQRAGQIIASSPDLESGLDAVSKDPTAAAWGGEAVANWRQAMLARQQYENEAQHGAKDGLDAVLGGSAASSAGDVSQLLPNIQGRLKLLSPQAQARAGQALQYILPALTAGVPTDPDAPPEAKAAASAQLQKNIIALGAGSGIPAETMYGAAGVMKPTTEYQPVGPGGAPAPVTLGGIQGGPADSTTASGPQGLSVGQKGYAEHRIADVADYEKNLDDRVLSGQDLSKNMRAIIDAAHSAQMGGGADTYSRLGSLLQAVGVNNDTVDKWANGSQAASQEIDKISLGTSMSQLKQQLTGVGGSRMNAQEFVAYLQKNPNLTTDPRAMVKVFNLWNNFYDKDLHEQDAIDQYKAKGGDMTRWPSQWSHSDFMKNWSPTTEISGEGVKGVPQAGTAPGVTHRWDPEKGLVPVGQ
jgi:hypothetical protein